MDPIGRAALRVCCVRRLSLAHLHSRACGLRFRCASIQQAPQPHGTGTWGLQSRLANQQTPRTYPLPTPIAAQGWKPRESSGDLVFALLSENSSFYQNAELLWWKHRRIIWFSFACDCASCSIDGARYGAVASSSRNSHTFLGGSWQFILKSILNNFKINQIIAFQVLLFGFANIRFVNIIVGHDDQLACYSNLIFYRFKPSCFHLKSDHSINMRHSAPPVIW